MTGEVVSEKIVSAMDLIREMLRHMKESINLLKEKEQMIRIENNGLTNNKIQLIESYLNQIGGVDEEDS